MSTPAAIVLNPVLPVWFIALMVVLFAASCWYTYRRCALERRQRAGLWALRLAAVVIIAGMLLQPSRRQGTAEEEPPLVVLAVDASASMSEQPEGSTTARDERARAFLEDSRTKKLLDRYRVIRYHLGTEVSEAADEDVSFNAPRSRISAGLNEIMRRVRGENVAGVILLSDGLDQSGVDLDAAAQAAPVYIPELEEPYEKVELEDDVWIAELSYPRRTVVGWKTRIDVMIRRRGDATVTCPVTLEENGSRLRSTVVEFDSGEHFRQVSFDIQPEKMGRRLYRVAIAPENDHKSENNAREFMVEVTDPQNRVLYLDRARLGETRFLRRALEDEERILVDAYVSFAGKFVSFGGEGGVAQQEVPAMTAEGLQPYKVVILGDLEVDSLSENAWKGLHDFVDGGGGLLLLGGARGLGEDGWSRAPALRALLPAASKPGGAMKEGRFPVVVTAAGGTHPALQSLPAEADLPELLSYWSPVVVNRFASVLLTALDGAPVLVVRRYGQGRIAMTLSDSLWRWQLAADMSVAGGSLYSQLISQIVYWLAPSEQEVARTGILQIFTAESEVDVRDRVVIGAVCDGLELEEDEAINCRIGTPDGRHLVLPMTAATLGADLGLVRPRTGFRCSFRPEVPGRYEVSASLPDGTQEASLALLAREPYAEQTGATLNRDYLRHVASRTGGTFVAWEERYAALEDMPYPVRDIEVYRESPIWNHVVWLLVLIVLFTLEWWWRRRLDLV
mgnify:CR=1 FL=1